MSPGNAATMQAMKRKCDFIFRRGFLQRVVLLGVWPWRRRFAGDSLKHIALLSQRECISLLFYHQSTLHCCHSVNVYLAGMLQAQLLRPFTSYMLRSRPGGPPDTICVSPLQKPASKNEITFAVYRLHCCRISGWHWIIRRLAGVSESITLLLS